MRQVSPTFPTESREMSTGRGLSAYLLLPMPGDLSMWAIIPATFLTGALADGASVGDVGKARRGIARLCSAARAVLIGPAPGMKPSISRPIWDAAAVVVGLISALMLMIWPTWLVVVASSLVLSEAAAQAELARPWMVFAPLAVALIHVMSRRQRLAGVGWAANTAHRLLARVGRSALRAAAGDKVAVQASAVSLGNARADSKLQARL
jgi:hypothetical protein